MIWLLSVLTTTDPCRRPPFPGNEPRRVSASSPPHSTRSAYLASHSRTRVCLLCGPWAPHAAPTRPFLVKLHTINWFAYTLDCQICETQVYADRVPQQMPRAPIWQYFREWIILHIWKRRILVISLILFNRVIWFKNPYCDPGCPENVLRKGGNPALHWGLHGRIQGSCQFTQATSLGDTGDWSPNSTAWRKLSGGHGNIYK